MPESSRTVNKVLGLAGTIALANQAFVLAIRIIDRIGSFQTALSLKAYMDVVSNPYATLAMLAGGLVLIWCVIKREHALDVQEAPTLWTPGHDPGEKKPKIRWFWLWAAISISVVAIAVAGIVAFAVSSSRRNVIPASVVTPTVVSNVHVLSPEKQAKLFELLKGPRCDKIYDIKAFTTNKIAASLSISFQDVHDPDAFQFAEQLKKILRQAGCEDAELGGDASSLVQNLDPFFGIKIWDGYNKKTREAAKLLKEALIEVRPDTSIIPGGDTEPTGGHFEGIAVIIGGLNN